MASAEDTFRLRKLEEGDFDKGFLQLLEQLTTLGDVSREDFVGRLTEAEGSPHYYTIVIEDTESGKIVGTARLLVELKYIHGCGKVGHIEDVVVDARLRGKRLGHRLIEDLIREAQHRGCYKVILDCSESNTGFYGKCGLVIKGVQMAQYME